jgi:dolichyl-phosphate-mannose-protein mannosyltransferase
MFFSQFKSYVQARLASLSASTYDCLLLVVVAAALTYIPAYKSAPMFWDENYHATSAQRYLDDIAQFEAHPPLGKLLIAAGEAVVRPNKGLDVTPLHGVKHLPGDQLPKGFSMAGMRLAPLLFAVFSAGAFFLLMRALTLSNAAALALSSLYVFENAFIVHFRAVHLDSFQMCFVLLALWRFVEGWRQEARLQVRDYAGLAALVALAMMIKINAGMFLLLMPMLYLREARLGWQSKDLALKVLAACAAMLAVVALVFTIHTALGRKMPDGATSAGKQDIEAMSPAYRDFIHFKRTLTPAVVATVTVDYFKFMSKSHLGVPKLDVCKVGENGSHPMHWPIMDKTINYRWDKTGDRVAYVQLAGNPVVWGLSLLAVLLSAGLIAGHRVFGQPVSDKPTYTLIEVFGGMYLVYMGLHLYLGSQRVMYLYHYFLGLMLGCVLLALCGRYLISARAAFARHVARWLGGMILLLVLGYLYVLPLTYHLHIGKTHCEWLNWPFKTVNCVN